jgi:hypothetical protein
MGKHRQLIRRDQIWSLGDHHVRCLDHGKRVIADLEREIVHRLIGDRRGNNVSAADIDADMRRR